MLRSDTTMTEAMKASLRQQQKDAVKTVLAGGDLPGQKFPAWGREYFAYDPLPTIRKVKQPLLILQGERDYQVTMAGDFEEWKAALGSKAGVTFRTYPALNHLFLAGAGKSVPAEYDTPGHVPVEVISDIAAWIAALK